MLNKIKRLIKESKKQDDGLNTWKREFKYTKDMRDRGEIMLHLASCLCEWNSVADIGCGNQQLKSSIVKINPKAKYIGIDRLAHCKDTIIADFNKGEFPSLKTDLVIVSGVFEYILNEMVDKFLDNVCGVAPIVAFSYCCTDYIKEREPIWVNHFKLGEIIDFFNIRGFHIERLEMYKSPNQFLMIFRKNAYML